MIRAKNYEAVSEFVKVMPRILWPLFSGHGVESSGLKAEKPSGHLADNYGKFCLQN